MGERALPWRALLLAPFASVPAISLTGLGSSDAGIASDVASGLVFGTLIGLPGAYLGMAIVGLPVYLLLRKLDLLKLWIVCAAGLAVPLAIMHGAPWRMRLGALGACLAVSVTAYLLLPRSLDLHRHG